MPFFQKPIQATADNQRISYQLFCKPFIAKTQQRATMSDSIRDSVEISDQPSDTTTTEPADIVMIVVVKDGVAADEAESIAHTVDGVFEANVIYEVRRGDHGDGVFCQVKGETVTAARIEAVTEALKTCGYANVYTYASDHESASRTHMMTFM
ncbi:hypothetical protein K4K51_001427 [Colletotrichum sp. SAR 10_75]|nr:hypothetical protein K4K51_001427 [Colletotrichum sp. SAR 10_75]